VRIGQRLHVCHDRGLFFGRQLQVSDEIGHGVGPVGRLRPAVGRQCLPFRRNLRRAARDAEQVSGRLFVGDGGAAQERRVVIVNDALQALEPAVVRVRFDEALALPLVHVAHGGRLEESRPVDADMTRNPQIGIADAAVGIQHLGHLRVPGRADVVVVVRGVVLEQLGPVIQGRSIGSAGRTIAVAAGAVGILPRGIQR